jgi:voltage-gated potassium channel
MRNWLEKLDLAWWLSQLTPYKRLWVTFFSMALIVMIGIIGYGLIEGWQAADAFYMTIITLSTVGFQEVRPLSDMGRIFTACLIVFGIATVGYAFGNVTAFLIEGELKQLFRIRKVTKTIEKLKDHIIICGYGHEGRHAADELKRSKVPFVVIEWDVELTEQLRDKALLVVEGDATRDDVLLSAGVSVAKGLIATLSHDSDNVFVSLTARGFNPNLQIISRAAHDTSVAKLYRAGANKVISSSEIGGRRIASALLRPHVLNFLDVIINDREMELRLEDIDIAAKSVFAGKSIGELQIRRNAGTLVVGYSSQGGAMQVNPHTATVLHAGDIIIVLGNNQQVEQLRDLANAKA